MNLWTGVREIVMALGRIQRFSALVAIGIGVRLLSIAVSPNSKIAKVNDTMPESSCQGVFRLFPVIYGIIAWELRIS
jgi:hypothetical protein